MWSPTNSLITESLRKAIEKQGPQMAPAMAIPAVIFIMFIMSILSIKSIMSIVSIKSVMFIMSVMGRSAHEIENVKCFL